MRKILFGSAALIALIVAHSAVAIDAELFVQPTNSSPVPVPSIGGSPVIESADNVAGNNTAATLTNGTVVGGLFSSGTITNPTSGQVVLGPIDTTGADSWSLQYTNISGSGAFLNIQESDSSAGPWQTVNMQSSLTNTSLITQTSSASQDISGPIKQKYIQAVITNSATEVLNVMGYLRSIPFVNTVNVPLINNTIKTQLSVSAAANNSAVPVTGSSSAYLIVVPDSIPEMTWQYSTAGTPITTATTTVIQVAGATGVRNYLGSLQISNTGAAATEIQILDGAAIIWDGQLGASVGMVPPITFKPPLRGSTATSMSIKTVSGVTISVTASAQGYQAF